MLHTHLSGQIVFNGRFFGRRITGVDRVAFEIIYAIDALLESKNELVRGLRFAIFVPPDVTPDTVFLHIPFVNVGSHHGQLWEQWDLPLALPQGTLLLNMCNSAPIWRARQLVIIHDAATVRAPESYSCAFRAWYRVLIPILFRFSRSICTVSNFSCRELRAVYGVRAEIAVLPEGVDHMLRCDADTRVLETHALRNRPYVLAVSSLSPHKNFAAVIRAVELIGDAWFDVVIAGGQNPRIFARSDGRLPRHVKYIGYVTDPELKALYANAACFVFPSFYEGYGLPPTEAMACGCPVVAAKAASIPEVCGNAAMYFDPNDPAELALILQKVMSDEVLRTKMRFDGKARAAELRWSTTAVALLNEIHRVA